MAQPEHVTPTQEIPIGEARAYVACGREIAVFNVDGTFYAIDNSCPHQGGPLAEGFIHGKIVTCPWHGWCFDVTTGVMTLGGYSSVDTFDVRVEGSTIKVSAEPRT